MIVSEPSTQATRPALVIVRNPATRDSRIIREADTLRRLGYMPLVLAVVSEDERTRHSKQDGIPVLRLSPTSPFSWAQRRLLRPGRPTDRGRTGDERNRGADSPRPCCRDRSDRWQYVSIAGFERSTSTGEQSESYE